MKHKRITITVSGGTRDAVDAALDEAIRKIKAGYRSETDHSKPYHFEVEAPDMTLQDVADGGLKVGNRVEFTCPVDRYPHFVVQPGMKGTITALDLDTISVKLDPGHGVENIEEWDDEVIWAPSNAEPGQEICDFFDSVRKIG